MFGQDAHKKELTVHFYNHNKPKDKKQSKLLIQGEIQSTICEYFITNSSVPLVTPMKYSKRKRIITSTKKRYTKYRAAPKPVELKCALCEFASVSNVKIIRHMKSSHTQPGSVNLDVMESRKTDVPRRLLIEDMSVCEISDEDEQNESNEEILLVENNLCKLCDFKHI